MIAALLVLLACRGDDAAREEATLQVAAEKVTLGTIRDLGSSVVRSSVRRATTDAKGGTRSAEEVTELRWQDPDHWSWQHVRDGRPLTRTIVWDGRAWSAHGDDALERKRDAEPYRVQLGQVWDPWGALEGLEEQLALVPGEVEELDGRRVVRHAVAPRPLPSKVRRTWVVEAAEGSVWIDEATALRLQADVRVTASSKVERQEITLAFTVGGIGADPQVTRPPLDPTAEDSPKADDEPTGVP